MNRSRLRNKFLKNKNEINRNNYKVQRNYCKKFLKTTKKQYFNNLNTSKVTENTTFWKTVVPLFTNKPSRGSKIILKEGNKNITNNSELCEVFNMYFSNIAASLNIPSVNNYITLKENTNKYSQKIKYFETQPSIATITKQCLSSSFNFQKTKANEVMKIISQLNTSKTCQNAYTPTKIIKINKDIFAKSISNNFNHCIDEHEFPYELKHGDVIPAHQKKDKCVKENYRSVSILTTSPKCMKNYCIINSIATLITSFPQINAVFEKGTVLSNAF